MESKAQIWNEMILLWQTDSTDDVFIELTEELQPSQDSSKKGRNIFERIFKSQKSDQLISNAEILKKLNEIEQNERTIEQNLLKKETELTTSSNLLNEAFISLMEQLEKYEQDKAIEHFKNAEKLAQKAYNRLAVFSVFGVLLSIFVLFGIIKYIRNSKKLNSILVNSKLEAESLAKSKELFMAKVSHDIRTPLNAISGFVKQLLTIPLEKTVKEKIEIVDQASDHLIRLINDVLDFTKLKSDKLTLYKSHFDPSELISNVCNLFYYLAKKNGNTIIYRIENDQNMVLFGDIHRLQQIIYNLLSNAVKFTEHGTIDVFAKISPENENTILFQLVVTDTGMGIDSSMLDIVFQEYTQEDQDVAIKYGGTGLGLTIVKRIVELFNGEIRLESKKGSGTKAICNLRFEYGKRDEIIKQNNIESSFYLPENLKILLADDEEYNRRLVSAILDKWSITYDVARNGLEAIELINNNRYDIILMDIRMPIINGVMATKYIRETLKISNSQTKIIGITAELSTNLPAETTDLFNKILSKPFSEKELFDVLNTENSEYMVDSNELPVEAKEMDIKLADLSNLLRTAGNDLNFIEEMIRQFNHSTDSGLNEIIIALESDQYNLIADLAHRIIPASRHLEIAKLVDILKDIETEALSQNKDVILKLTLEAKKILPKAVVDLESQYQQLKNK